MKKITSLVLTLIMLMTLTACGNDGSSQTEGGEGDTTPPASGETAILTIGTGDTGGAMYPIGSTIAKIVNNNVPGVKMNVESTGGSVDNARMTSTGELELGLCGGDVAYSAQNGKDAFEGAACEGYSGLFAYSVSTAIFISSQASGVDSVEDWAGHRLTFGMTGSSTATALANQLPVAGVELTDLEPQYMSVAEGAEAIQNGQSDGIFGLGTMPQSALLELANNTPCNFFSYSAEQIDSIIAEAPYYFKTTLPAETFNGQSDDLETFGVKGMVLVNNDMDEDLVYEICKAVWENMEDMYAGHSSLSVMTEDFVAKDLPIELHPGAVRFWTEMGMMD